MGREDIVELLSKDLKPVVVLPSPIRAALAWFVTAILLVTMSFVMMPFRSDILQKLREVPYVFQAIWLLLVSLISAVSVSRIGRPGQSGQKVLPVVAAALIGIFISLFSYKVLRIFLHVENGAGFDWEGIRCMGAILMLSVLPAALFFWTSRKTAPIFPGLSGSFIGLASGTIAATALAFSCGSDEPVHLLGWHYLLPLVLLGAVGFGLGRKLLRW